MTSKPKILVIGNSILECIKISNFFIDYTYYVDYESNLSNLSQDDFNNYDIYIYDYDNINQFNLEDVINNSTNKIKILITSITDEGVISYLMKNGIDIIIQYSLNKEIVKQIMLIYSLI